MTRFVLRPGRPEVDREESRGALISSERQLQVTVGQRPWMRICRKRSGGCGRGREISSVQGTAADRAILNGSRFQAQQSAEKSLKALLYARGFRKILTHSVYELTREVGAFEPSFLELKSGAKALDSAYIMTRYPDSIVGNLTPSEYYDREDAEECIEYADSICSAARRSLSG
jgi:HEPN domain-containing protein